MDTDNHVLIASGTASGKTEAAFFPMLTLLDKYPSNSIGIMYIGPLKALINDQFKRLNDLLINSNIPVWPWHGDVSQTQKNKALKNSRGVLLITPESLEALLMLHSADAYRLFSDLRFVVIDEIHILMGIDRGLQVLSLIRRIEILTGCKPRRIGLSATLNDYGPVLNYLSAQSNKNAIAVGTKKLKRKILLCVESFVLSQNEDENYKIKKNYIKFIYNNCYSKKCLIFTNSRSKAEMLILDLKREAMNRNERDIFYVHHGSVSAELRKKVETALKENDGPTVAAATLTLELGIDIGDLNSIIQIGAPYSCSSFVQRLGRSGRKTGKSQMMFINLYEISKRNNFASLPWDLLQSIAVIQLYLEEHWVEPFKQKKKPFSLLAHQTLSVLMSKGELSPPELARHILSLPPFINNISTVEYKDLLKYMLQEDYLQRLGNGKIIVGLKGEKICNHFSFYAVFQDEEVYRVINKSKEIGNLNFNPGVGTIFVLAGKSWIVTSADDKKNIIYVEQSNSKGAPHWYGSGVHVDTKIVKMIKKILQEDDIYPYLQPNAKNLLLYSRKVARESGLLEHDIIKYDDNSFFLCPWIGTKELYTISKLFSFQVNKELQINNVNYNKYYLEFKSKLGKSELKKVFDKLNVDAIINNISDKTFMIQRIDKYDYMVPDNLLYIAYLYNQMDINFAINCLKNLMW